MNLIVTPFQHLIEARLKLVYLLLMVAVFTSCTEKEDFTETFIGNYLGNYSGTAQDNFHDKVSYSRKDTTYTDVRVSIARSAEDSKKVKVTVHLPTGGWRNYHSVDVSDNKLVFSFSARGCGCSQRIEGEIKDNILRLSLRDYSSGVIDSNMSVEAIKIK